MNKKKSIFVFIYGYLPGQNYGGPVTSIYNFTEQFGDEYDIRIVCSNHEHNSKVPYEKVNKSWNKVGKANVLYLSEKQYTTSNFKKIMQPFNIILVYLTGVFSYKLNHSAIMASNHMNIKVLIAIRGEICRNILKMKSYKKIPYLFIMKTIGEYKNVLFQVTSIEEKNQLKKYLGIKEKNIIFLPNIGCVKQDIVNIEKKKEKGQVKLLFLSRIHPKKNLLDALNAIIRAKGKIQFDIYGPIEDYNYWNKCKEVILKAPSNIAIKYKGALSMMDAKKIYSQYHFFLFPTLSENYGHVIVESLMSGCPLILTEGTTPWDNIKDKAGFTFELHNIKELTDIINKVVDMNQQNYYQLICNINSFITTNIDYKGVINKYRKLLYFIDEK